MKWTDGELYKQIGSILKKARNEKRISLDTMVELIGGVKTKSTLQRYESGESRMDMPTLDLLCSKLGLDMYEVIGNAQASMYPAKENYSNVPLYSSLCCGNGGFVEDNIIDFVPVPTKVLSVTREYFCQYAQGDSMKDAGINDGDLLVFEKTSTIENNQIGCFCTDDNIATCKKFKTNNGIISLIPMNSAYDPIIIDVSCSNFRCLGRLKYSIKKYY